MSALRQLATAAALAAATGASGSAFAVPGDAGSPEARALIARVVEAYGGRAALERVRAYRLEGELFSIRRHDESPTVRVFARPGRLKVLIGYEGAGEARIVDGAKGWRSADEGPIEEAHGPMLDAMVLQAARADVPWILIEHAAEARWLPAQDVDSVACEGLEFALPGGLTFRAFVDPRDHRVRMSQGALAHGGMQTHFETFYDDFRAVDGVWFAFRERNWASGTQTGVTSVTRVILNPRLRADEFRPPKGGAAPKARGDS